MRKPDLCSGVSGRWGKESSLPHTRSRCGSSLLYIFGAWLLSLLLAAACTKNPTPGEPPPPPLPSPEAKLTLAPVDVGLTDAYLKLHVENVTFPQMVEVTRHPAGQGGADTLLFADSLYASDTLLYDSSLTFGSSYTYIAYLIENGSRTVSSTPLAITTLDTTSHEFNWEIYEFGEVHGSSVLYDVAIISPTDIWAVGRIYLTDSTGRVITYNAVHWDGNEWELKRIRTNACGGVDYPPIEAIFAFSANDILFSHIDGSLTHFDGNNFVNDCSLIIQLNGSAKKIWGVSSNDFYVVSGNGFIAHYDGSSWQRIESGTETTIQDIWGAQDPYTGEWIILCAASPGYGVSGAAIFRIKPDHTVEELPWVSGRASQSIWFDTPYTLFVCGSGIFRKRNCNGWEEIGGVDVIPAQTERIRGMSLNDIFVVGHFGYIAHFNGNDFSVIRPNGAILYMSCDYQNNLMVAVGEDGRKGYLLRMFR